MAHLQACDHLPKDCVLAVKVPAGQGVCRAEGWERGGIGPRRVAPLGCIRPERPGGARRHAGEGATQRRLPRRVWCPWRAGPRRAAHGAGPSMIEKCAVLVFGPALAMESSPMRSCFSLRPPATHRVTAQWKGMPHAQHSKLAAAPAGARRTMSGCAAPVDCGAARGGWPPVPASVRPQECVRRPRRTCVVPELAAEHRLHLGARLVDEALYDPVKGAALGGRQSRGVWGLGEGRKGRRGNSGAELALDRGSRVPGVIGRMLAVLCPGWRAACCKRTYVSRD